MENWRQAVQHFNLRLKRWRNQTLKMGLFKILRQNHGDWQWHTSEI